ncbi:MAG: amino acid ABC transporter substrate-binding protein [Azoarcus sp.]|jgi:glutamate/aspartate transport system substrate-binding protein|nr:amino acid ABC transporter substrate-binding protein [Azoarcus sp.]
MSPRVNALFFSCLCAAILTLPAATPRAQNAPQTTPTWTDTLEKIRQTGKITISYRLANIPFSYLDSGQSPAGYAKDLCDRVVETIKAKYDLPGLATIYYPVNAENRMPALRDGMVDLDCGSTTNNHERRKDANFSITYFVSNIRMLTRKDHGINDFSDLAGKTVVVTKGTTAEKILREKVDLDALHIKVLYGKTHSDSFLIVRSGRAQAYVTDDILLAGLIASSSDTHGAYQIVGPSLSSEHYAVMMRKGDGRLKALVDAALKELIASGEAARLYAHWFMNPIPPNGIALNLPMSAELQQAFARPTDAGGDQTLMATDTQTPSQ